MRHIASALVACASITLLPSMLYAQATLTGIVRDSSGAVLPGVTVDASSPALIEKVRSTVTDGTGQYLIVDLPPVEYRLAFSLTGFNSVARGRRVDRIRSLHDSGGNARRQPPGTDRGARRDAGRERPERAT